jgi:transcriptional regulator with PAS, ATPase and Fis domain
MGSDRHGFGASENPKLSAALVIKPEQALSVCKAMLRVHKGNVAQAARALKVSTRTLWRWINRHEELRDALDAARNNAKRKS